MTPIAQSNWTVTTRSGGTIMIVLNQVEFLPKEAQELSAAILRWTEKATAK